jgi:ferredoxin/flavodoxin
MGTTIFYFTGTGNSLMLTRDLAGELGGARIISMAKAIKEPEIELSDECIGFVFPVFFGSTPLIVRDFITKLPLDNSKYVFTIANCANTSGLALNHVAALLAEKGVELGSGFQMPLPENYIIVFNPPGIAKQEKIFNREKLKIKAIAQAIKTQRRIGIEKIPLAALTRLIMPLYYRIAGMETDSKRAAKIHHSSRKFKTDSHCTGCGLCQSVCPVGNIEMVNGRPKWQDHCEQCLACINWCPAKTVEYGDKTIKRSRYTNPAVIAKDIIEAAGHHTTISPISHTEG